MTFLFIHFLPTGSRDEPNIFITNLSGYKLLRYPWYWYYKPFINLLKIIVPRKLIVYIKKK